MGLSLRDVDRRKLSHRYLAGLARNRQLTPAYLRHTRGVPFDCPHHGC
jgi:hypothetical protein